MLEVETFVEFRTGNGYFPGNHFYIPSDNKASIKCPCVRILTVICSTIFSVVVTLIVSEENLKQSQLLIHYPSEMLWTMKKTLFNVVTFVKEL